MYLRCNVCGEAVRRPNNHLVCQICQVIAHNDCAFKNVSSYYCKKCNDDIYPFNSIDNAELIHLYDVDIYECVNLLQNVNWEERLPDLTDKMEICNYFSMNDYRSLVASSNNNDFLMLQMNGSKN